MTGKSATRRRDPARTAILWMVCLGGLFAAAGLAGMTTPARAITPLCRVGQSVTLSGTISSGFEQANGGAFAEVSDTEPCDVGLVGVSGKLSDVPEECKEGAQFIASGTITDEALDDLLEAENIVCK